MASGSAIIINNSTQNTSFPLGYASSISKYNLQFMEHNHWYLLIKRTIDLPLQCVPHRSDKIIRYVNEKENTHVPVAHD